MGTLFKRGNHSTLNNTELTQGLIFFTTDDNAIYMDDLDSNKKLQRYKIFGLNDNDIVETKQDASLNTYFDDASTYFLKQASVATDGNTTNKIAIGSGYYSNVIGDNIEDILYKAHPTITSSISYLQNNARARLTEIWTNENPSNTWQADLSSSNPSSNESLTIPLSTQYLGYIILVKASIDEDAVYPMTIYSLPTSIVANSGATAYGDSKNVTYLICNDYEYDEDSRTDTYTTIFNGYASIDCQINTTNNSIIITKKGDRYDGTFDFHNYLIPIKVYGWGL